MGGFAGLTATIILSIKLFITGFLYEQYATPGEAGLFAVLSIITIQLFLAFLYYDATQQPLLRLLKSR